MEKAWLSHFQDSDYCTMAWKVPCAHLKIDRCIWKLALFSICSKTGLPHAMPSLSTMCRRVQQWVFCTSAPCQSSLPGSHSLKGWGSDGTPVRNLPWATLLLPRMKSCSVSSAVSDHGEFCKCTGKSGQLMSYPAAHSWFSYKALALILACEMNVKAC